ncbi:DUF1062 domain-containing protein [Chryseobacterium sp. BIGb0232]|uniref:DUF1062 domain-containing protein n=1 Tax=Chryseobacterium sp. BIGb0232 TaxID=2940598 RepID=UPI000F496069|nr:DUF1062 domain-containing protein [Chryseobacterium sp. BIGb0232]MCS4304044.1 hypothetical protein [Chryseobacterium sp. BIGb0232]ROS17627.1 hypothetical protein EDF65_1999 [Chryseobacterium nakagawai]
MSIEYTWVIKAKNTPLFKKKCNHCDSERFHCSDKFRLNAQKKNIDIWLIYRCVKCHHRYNMTVFSRIRTESISKEKFNQLSENDVNLVWEYAFSHETRRKNNAEADLYSVEYEIQFDEVSVEEITSCEDEMLSFTIKYPFEFNLRLSTVIRTCLNLSSGKLNQLIDAEAILVHERPLQKKHKVKNGDVIRIHKDKLKTILWKEELYDEVAVK